MFEQPWGVRAAMHEAKAMQTVQRMRSALSAWTLPDMMRPLLPRKTLCWAVIVLYKGDALHVSAGAVCIMLRGSPP